MSERELSPEPAAASVFTRAGGAAAFRRLVDDFYRGVEGDAVLRPMYPDDLTDSREHLALFLMQFFGGPTTYSDARGHPRLRARHFPFPIDVAARDAWFGHMSAAVHAQQFAEDVAAGFIDYFDRASTFLVNQE